MSSIQFRRNHLDKYAVYTFHWVKNMHLGSFIFAERHVYWKCRKRAVFSLLPTEDNKVVVKWNAHTHAHTVEHCIVKWFLGDTFSMLHSVCSDDEWNNSSLIKSYGLHHDDKVGYIDFSARPSPQIERDENSIRAAPRRALLWWNLLAARTGSTRLQLTSWNLSMRPIELSMVWLRISKPSSLVCQKNKMNFI